MLSTAVLPVAAIAAGFILLMLVLGFVSVWSNLPDKK